MDKEQTKIHVVTYRWCRFTSVLRSPWLFSPKSFNLFLSSFSFTKEYTSFGISLLFWTFFEELWTKTKCIALIILYLSQILFKQHPIYNFIFSWFYSEFKSTLSTFDGHRFGVILVSWKECCSKDKNLTFLASWTEYLVINLPFWQH